MKKLFAFLFVLAAVFAFSISVQGPSGVVMTHDSPGFSLQLSPASAMAGWTVTTNWTGKWTCKITLEATDLSNSAGTNYTLSKGFLKGKVVPNEWHVTYLTNGPDAATNSYQVVRIITQGPSATNLSVRCIPAKGTSMVRYRYIRFIYFMQYIRPGLR